MLTDAQMTVLTDAMARHVPVQISYLDKEGKHSERIVTPQSVTADGRNLTAWCHSRNALRHFRLERIQSASEAEGQPQLSEDGAGGPPLLELPALVRLSWFEVRVDAQRLPAWLESGAAYAQAGGWLSHREGWLSGEGAFDAEQAAAWLSELCAALDDELLLELEREDRLPGFRLLLTPQGPAREDGHRVQLTAAAPVA